MDLEVLASVSITPAQTWKSSSISAPAAASWVCAVSAAFRSRLPRNTPTIMRTQINSGTIPVTRKPKSSFPRKERFHRSRIMTHPPRAGRTTAG